jgi:mRNA-degrading endonuclease YafQ of YafQ-DinJ toxin-antitoxin module
MVIKQIRTDSLFDRNYKKLSAKVKSKAIIKERIFRVNPFCPVLRTHKLHGKEKEVWAFWIDQKHRIKFIFLDAGVVLFLDVGTHDIY